jgi:inner membrane protein COX18
MESLRGMCGNNNGILLWLLSCWEGSVNPAQASESLHLTIEPSLAAEGALWFPDLLAGDSTGILPVILTASILHNVTASWKKKSFKSVSDLPSLQMYRESSFIGLRYFIQVMAVYVGAASFFSQMPVALMLYWITSTNTATLQSWYLEKRVFNEKKPKHFEKKYITFEKKGVEDPFQIKNLR